MADRVRVREISNEEGQRLLRIVRRSSGSVVTWRRAQMVLLSAQGMDVAQIAKVAFTSEDRVRAVLHNFNDDGFESLYPKYSGGRPPTFTLPQRREIKKIALARPEDHDLPFSTWSLAKLADFLVAEGVVDDISHEGLRALLREEGVSFQAIKTFKVSNDPDFEAKKNRVLELYDIADGKVKPKRGDPTVVLCVDEFGPLNLQPHPGPSGHRSPLARVSPARPVGGAGGRRSPDLTVSATCSPPTTWGGTGSMGTSSPASAASSSWRSTATCGRCIPPTCGSRSCSTTSAPTCRRPRTSASGTGRRRTTSSLPTCRSTRGDVLRSL
jgi:transposase